MRFGDRYQSGALRVGINEKHLVPAIAGVRSEGCRNVNADGRFANSAFLVKNGDDFWMCGWHSITSLIRVHFPGSITSFTHLLKKQNGDPEIAAVRAGPRGRLYRGDRPPV
jgi:hypothetical protein